MPSLISLILNSKEEKNNCPHCQENKITLCFLDQTKETIAIFAMNEIDIKILNGGQIKMSKYMCVS